jgi:S1-C subfamily serine protease
MRLINRILIAILISLILFSFGWNIYDIRQERKLDKEFSQRELQINNQILRNIYKQLNKQNIKIDKIPILIKENKIKLEKELQQVNIMVQNQTVQALGSGVTLKYKDKFYVLSAGHMAEQETDKLELWENNDKVCDLKIVKWEYITTEGNNLITDLILLEPVDENIRPKYYVELADNEPIIGSEVYIVGNPMGIDDVVSEGRVALYRENFMYFRDSTYFGNSGGGIFTKEGKLVGIMSHVIPLQPFYDYPPFILEGCVRLNTIIEFLENVS